MAALGSTGEESPLQELLVALALVMVIEGIWPFIGPESFRRVLLTVAGEGESSLRIAGLVSMLIGLGMLYLVH